MCSSEDTRHLFLAQGFLIIGKLIRLNCIQGAGVSTAYKMKLIFMLNTQWLMNAEKSSS